MWSSIWPTACRMFALLNVARIDLSRNSLETDNQIRVECAVKLHTSLHGRGWFVCQSHPIPYKSIITLSQSSSRLTPGVKLCNFVPSMLPVAAVNDSGWRRPGSCSAHYRSLSCLISAGCVQDLDGL